MIDLFSEFHFLRPAWLFLLIALPLVLFVQLRIARRSNSWFNVISPDLFDALVGSNPTKKRRLVLALPSVVLILASISLAGPTYERLPQPVESKMDALVVVLDMTLSMQSQDVVPSRIERAKFKITDILERRDEGLTALVAYAGDAYVVTPLTSDDSTITNLLPSLNPEMMPIRGSNAVIAITRANELLNSLATEEGGILLLTDGISDFSALLREVDPKYPISVLGVGLPSRAGGNSGAQSINEDMLRDLARLASGRFHLITTSDEDIEYLLTSSVLPDTQLLEDQRFDLWHDVGFYLIFPIALLLAWSMRRGGLVIVVLAIGVNAEAGWLDDLWQTRDRQGYSQLERGDFESAANLFDDPSWRGVAKFRQGEYAEAGESFDNTDSVSAAYNSANALAWQGKFSEAIEKFEAVLEDVPDHEDAAHNKAVLEELLKQLENQSNEQGDQEEQGEQQNPQEGSEGEESQENEGESQKQQQEQQDQSTAQQSQSDEQEAEANDSQQAQQAQQQEEMDERESQQSDVTTLEEETSEQRELREIQERWLRRIPEDPGGLLRRKFTSESNARIERGELDRSETGAAW